jgi:hypothetical protein
MSKEAIKRGLAVGAIGALAAVPTAVAQPPEGVGKPPEGVGKPADPGSQGKGHAKGKSNGVTYVFKGTYAGAGAVDVVKGNAHVTRANLDGTTVTFDLTNAKFSVADTNADTVVDVNDVVAGDKVVVKSKLPRKDPGAQPFAARQLVDQTHPAP